MLFRTKPKLTAADNNRNAQTFLTGPIHNALSFKRATDFGSAHCPIGGKTGLPPTLAVKGGLDDIAGPTLCKIKCLCENSLIRIP